MIWKEGALSEAEIVSLHGGLCRIRAAGRFAVLSEGREVEAEVEAANGDATADRQQRVIAFRTEAGKSYTLSRLND